MRWHLSLILGYALTASAGHAPALTQGDSRPDGCYELRVGEWIKRSGTRPPTYPLPSHVRLHSEAVDTGAWRLAPPIPELEGDQPDRWPSWSVRGPILRLVWSTGYEALIVQVRIAPDSQYAGYVETFSDIKVVRAGMPALRSRAPAVLIRSECT